MTITIHYHDGEQDFPHGAGASDPGWYIYVGAISPDSEPDGPWPTFIDAATTAALHLGEANHPL